MIRNVIGSDGKMHIEEEFGDGDYRTRIDLTRGGLVSHVIKGQGGFDTVFGPNGVMHLESQIGNMRQQVGRSGYEIEL